MRSRKQRFSGSCSFLISPIASKAFLVFPSSGLVFRHLTGTRDAVTRMPLEGFQSMFAHTEFTFLTWFWLFLTLKRPFLRPHWLAPTPPVLIGWLSSYRLGVKKNILFEIEPRNNRRLEDVSFCGAIVQKSFFAYLLRHRSWFEWQINKIGVINCWQTDCFWKSSIRRSFSSVVSGLQHLPALE